MKPSEKRQGPPFRGCAGHRLSQDTCFRCRQGRCPAARFLLHRPKVMPASIGFTEAPCQHRRSSIISPMNAQNCRRSLKPSRYWGRLASIFPDLRLAFGYRSGTSLRQFAFQAPPCLEPPESARKRILRRASRNKTPRFIGVGSPRARRCMSMNYQIARAQLPRRRSRCPAPPAGACCAAGPVKSRRQQRVFRERGPARDILASGWFKPRNPHRAALQEFRVKQPASRRRSSLAESPGAMPWMTYPVIAPRSASVPIH